ncbi:uncharacterized protein LOC110101901 [Dendrobium catenatum]|uniref:ENT domain-containing protein n=1 Tax=Dendrobium catenatum TaxID=906689 RepID=A0A2I0WBE9_9ASPA|nr:uncharacterized protein LOC110101901 [Dendrobium catenatum]PKU72977.1 hypothetical protein MA16_Dca007540 [Dendrobium catenatum]
MRFMKGSKVEVLNKSEDPDGSWWCAEIISGNGHNYYVRYDRHLPDVGSSMERVPRRAIRPRPQSEKGRLDWVPGDIVEVLNNFSWFVAKIIMFSSGEYFSVRLHGSSTELIVHSSCIRLRKCWQDDKWFVFRKYSAKCCDKITNGVSKEKLISNVPQPIDDQGTSQFFARIVKKRARNCSRSLEKCTGTFTKMRAVEKEGVFEWNSALEKVDAVTSPRTKFGEKCLYSSLINRNTATFETNQVVLVSNADGGRCYRFRLQGTDAESISSSVGSCGVNKSPCRSTCDPFNGMGQDMKSHNDLYEASAILGRKKSLTTSAALDQGIHSLELQAYRCTISAFYASGPMNWEQEALLTDLRRMLHISNDEHLLELKNLASGQINNSVR